MKNEWHELTKLTGGHAITVEQVHTGDSDICVKVSFGLPSLAQFPAQGVLAITYPIVKNRLNRISAPFKFVEVDSAPDRTAVRAQLERGATTPEAAMCRLST